MARKCRYCGKEECLCWSGLGTLNKTPHQQRVEEFMLRASQDVPSRPTRPEEAVLRLRARLILEEALETLRALGYDIVFDPEANDYTVVDCNTGLDMIEAVDGCCDLSVVTIGTLSALGVGDRPVLTAIDQSNLEKFAGDGHLDRHGKWIKNSDWKAPNLKRLLVQQGWDV